MIFQLAVRNILAHKKRSIVTLILIASSTAMLVFASAWMEGSHALMLKNAVEIYPGYIQICDKDFPAATSYDHLIFDASAIEKILNNQPNIASYAMRFESFVLFSGDEKSVGAMLTGVQPAREVYLSRLAASLQRGSYLTTDDTNQIYIGAELAKRLKVEVDDELAFVGSGADYSFTADKVIIKGIFKTGLFDFDASSAFINKKYFDHIMAAQNLATQFVVLPKNPQLAQQVAEILNAELSIKVAEQYQAQSWQQRMSGLVQAMELDSMFGYITLGVIFIVIFFVVMIYTLLAVYGRVREIGVMRAIGTTPSQIMAMLMLENGLLASLSVFAGGIVGGILAVYFEYNPIVISGMEEQFKQYGLAVSSMPTIFMPAMIVRDMTVMFVLTLLSTLYPVLKVNRIPPIEAIHHV